MIDDGNDYLNLRRIDRAFLADAGTIGIGIYVYLLETDNGRWINSIHANETILIKRLIILNASIVLALKITRLKNF